MFYITIVYNSTQLWAFDFAMQEEFPLKEETKR